MAFKWHSTGNIMLDFIDTWGAELPDDEKIEILRSEIRRMRAVGGNKHYISKLEISWRAGKLLNKINTNMIEVLNERIAELTMGEVKEFREPMPLPIPKLKSIDGGQGGEGNWLDGIEPGTVFAAANLGESFMVGIFVVTFKWQRVTKLTVRLAEGREEVIFVDTKKFSKTHELKEILLAAEQSSGLEEN